MYVEHVGDPGNRVPVAGVKRGEGPFEVFDTQAGINMLIGDDIDRVVEVDEVVMQRWQVSDDSDKY